MVDENDIIRMAAMMRLELDDKKGMVQDVRKILEYFDTLDSAGVEDEQISGDAIPLDRLRPDQTDDAQRDIDRYGNRDSDGYIMAPKVG